MTISSELNKLNANLNNAYTAVSDRGGDLPISPNFDNLASAIQTIPSYKWMGDELRKAYAYTNVQEGSGRSQILYPNGSSPYKSTELYNSVECYQSTVVIDGKAYIVSISNSQLILTQIGTETDWEIVLNYISATSSFICGIRNGKLYSESTVEVNDINSWIPMKGKPSTAGVIIVDGSLYYTAYKSSEFKIIDNTGIWTSVCYGTGPTIGIRNGYLTAVHSTYGMSIFSDFTIRDNCYISDGSSILAINDNLEVYAISYSRGTFTATKKATLSKTPKQLIYPGSMSGAYGYIVFNTDNTIDFYTSNFSLKRTEENCKDIVVLSINPAYYVLKNNGDLYHVTLDNYGTVNFTLLENIGSNASLFGYFVAYMNGSPGVFKIVYSDTNPVYTTLYVPSTIGTNAYVNTEIVSATQTITSTTSNSIIVDGREYFRDSTKDSIFEFIPPELANHQFTDQELCQAYLSAGAKIDS